MGNEEMAARAASSVLPPVSEKAFEDYHLYTLARPATLHDRESKQVEFIRASGVKSERIYVYDGLKIDWNQWRGYRMENIRGNGDKGRSHARIQEFGGESSGYAATKRTRAFLQTGHGQTTRVHR